MITNQTITVGGITVNYDENTIYMTPQNTPLYATDLADWAKAANKPTYTAQEVGALPADTVIPDVPVQDVQVNGDSILQNGIANVPTATPNRLGVIKPDSNCLLTTADGMLSFVIASSAVIKAGTNARAPLAAKRQHESVFYGLAKAAGHDEASSTEPVGTYTTEAKTAIRAMLGLDDQSIVDIVQAGLPAAEGVSW